MRIAHDRVLWSQQRDVKGLCNRAGRPGRAMYADASISMEKKKQEG
jgi:hypothetical protein